MSTRLIAAVAALLAFALTGGAASAAQAPGKSQGKGGAQAAAQAAAPAQSNRPARHAPCVRGEADGFPCHRVDLLSYFWMEEIGGSQVVGQGRGSDVWGWEDPATRREYVIAGRENGTAFVDITDPKRPVYLANLPSASPQNVIWRDIKVYEDHAFIVSEALNHGMQVFDLTQLRSIDRSAAPVNVAATAHYTGFGRAHNLNINEETGYAYAVGIREGIDCDHGMHMMDISNPTTPVFAGCFAQDGYIHDTQCVVYRGADARYLGREICFTASPTPPGPHAVTIVDVTNKANPVILSKTPYEGAAYSHQGWLTPNQEQFIFGDEGDEGAFGHNTRTLVFDVRNLESPAHIGTHFGPTRAINHNIYTENRWVYQSNYTAGLRILDGRRVADGILEEVAYFDTYPPHNNAVFGFGTWSNYAWFSSGVIAVHGYQGLWIVKARLGQQN